jgi:hypothetical protein
VSDWEAQEFAKRARRANQSTKTRAKLLPHSAFSSLYECRVAETTVTAPESVHGHDHHETSRTVTLRRFPIDRPI